ncbi:MAG TPA: adenosine deaminase [Candidatus Baltobacteraceae bacterium]|nr:adenosine deaminase [Candidatus Baltobacteraceae bacterium]
MQSLDPAIASLPKIHLHCHLEGCLRPQTFVDLTRRYGLSTRYRPGAAEVAGPTDPALVYQFSGFPEFLLIFAAVSRALASPDDYARLAHEFVHDALAQNVVYGELFISPSVWAYFHPGLDLVATIRSMLAELRLARAHGAEFSLIVDVTRNFGAESAMRTARLAASLAGDGVIGIGLGGDEARFPAGGFGEVFAVARAHGLHTVAHAGEADGARSVRAAIEIGAERIGHGVRAIEDPAVVALLRERGIALEICPTSNLCTGTVPAGADHPLHELDANGVLVTIDADDPAIFGTSISQEYALVAQRAGIETLRRYIAQAAGAAFLEPAAKAALAAKLERRDVRS